MLPAGACQNAQLRTTVLTSIIGMTERAPLQALGKIGSLVPDVGAEMISLRGSGGVNTGLAFRVWGREGKK